MSAIWGQVSFDSSSNTSINAPASAGLAAAMRGPYEKKCKIDNISEHTGSGCYFGAGIQFITKEAEYENQPIAENGMIFASDCILDNREELIPLFEADSFSENLLNSVSGVAQETASEIGPKAAPESAPGTQSYLIPDGTLMYSVLKQGVSTGIKKLLGIFSFALYNTSEKKLTLAVDPTSSRCLYYYVSGKTVTFSTLIEPILAAAKQAGKEISFNQNYLKDFLCAPGLIPNLSATETPYSGIYKIKAGHYIQFTAKGIKDFEYFSPAGTDYLKGEFLLEKTHRKEIPSRKTASAYGTTFRALFEDCVSRLLRAENTAMALSSGFDSGSVGAVAADILESRGKKLTGYTYVPFEKPGKDRNRHNVHNETTAVLDLAKMHPAIEPHFLNNGGKNSIDPLKEETEFMEIPFKAYGNFPSLCEIYQSAYDAGCRIVLNGQFGNSTVSHGYIDDVLYELWKSGHKLRFLKNLNHYSTTVKESRKAALKGCRNYFEYALKKEREAYTLTDKAESISPGTVQAVTGAEQTLSDTEHALATSDSSSLWNKKNAPSPVNPLFTPEGPFLNPDELGDYTFSERMLSAGFNIAERIPESAARYRSNLCNKPPYSYIGEMETKMSLKFGVVLRDATRDPRMLQFCYHLPYELFAHGGTPRWLIRHNLSDLLPESITGDWLRYGVQNSDCYARIKRDRDTIFPGIERQISDNLTLLSAFPFIDTDKMLEFLNSCKTTLPDSEEEIMEFLFAYELVLFISEGLNRSE